MRNLYSSYPASQPGLYVAMLKNLLLFLITGYVLFFILAYFFTDKLIFFPPSPGYHDSDQVIKIPTANGAVIAAFYLPNKQAKYTLLISHGNAEDIGYMLPWLRALQQHGFAVFAYDYEGYGLSSGKSNEQNTYNDINAAYDYLTRKINIPANKIIAYGTSIGAAVTIDLASREPIAGIILQSPFTSALRVVTRVKIFPFDKYNNLKKITKITCPILFIHGTSDRIVAIWHGKKLYQTAQAPKQYLWVPGAGHNDLIYVAGTSYWQALDRFVRLLSEP